MMAEQWLAAMIVLGQAVSGIHGVNTDCMLGSIADEGSPQMTRGQYVDLEHPLSCSGAIVAWHFCFYTENIASAGDGDTDYTVYFRVYRNESESQLVRVHEVITSLRMNRQDVENTSFKCMDNEDQYLNVSQGDYLAVYLRTFSSPLVIVGTNIPGSLYRDNRSLLTLLTSTTVPRSNLEEVEDSIFHLSADVMSFGHNTDPIISTSTTSILTDSVPHTMTNAIPSPTSSETTSSQTPATEPGNGSVEKDGGSDSGLSSGGIAAIVIVIILVFALLVAIVLLLAIYLRRHFGLRDKKMYHGSVDSIDNAVYELPNTSPYSKSSNFPIDYETPMGHSMKKISTSDKSSPGNECHYLIPEPGELDTSFSRGEMLDTETVKMHYEQATAEVFNIYASTLRLSSADFSTRIKKFVSSLKRTTAIPYHAPPSEEKEIYQQLSKCNLPHISSDQIEITGRIGSGQFADVDKAWWMADNGSTQVAVKTLHEDSAGRSRVRCLQEAALMAQFHHPNVVTLHGIINEDKISLVMEFLFKGDLQQHLLAMRPNPGELVEANTARRLLSYSHQVALGMLYLSDRGFVHRDLATRNVFVSDREVCKIGDFGMSRDLADSEYYVSEGGEIPLKWTAPEAVYYGKYSTASDVWSYGCLLYEIWSMGLKPFTDTPNAEVLNKLSSGYRLPPPPGCPKDVYKLMIECWNPFPNNRPGFRDTLVSLLKEEEEILSIPVEDASTHRQASCLGANMEAGYNMYLDLQETYKSCDVPDFDDSVYESMAQVGSIQRSMIRIEEENVEPNNLQDEEEVYDDVDIKPPMSQQSHNASDDEEIYASISDEMENDVESSNSSNIRPLQNSAPSLPPRTQSHTIQPGNGTLVHSVENTNLTTGGDERVNEHTQPQEDVIYDVVDY